MRYFIKDTNGKVISVVAVSYFILSEFLFLETLICSEGNTNQKEDTFKVNGVEK